jgi:hypothetical protein
VNVEKLRADMQQAGIVMEWDGTGYGPDWHKHWPADALYWKLRPAEYQKIPIRLDPSWGSYKQNPDLADETVQCFDSLEQWCRKKPGLDWLYPFIDTDSDGKISPEEFQKFLEHKRKRQPDSPSGPTSP